MARWKPKQSERYYFITSNGSVALLPWLNDEFDQGCYNFGNVFRTKEEVQRALEKIKETLLKCQEEIEQ